MAGVGCSWREGWEVRLEKSAEAGEGGSHSGPWGHSEELDFLYSQYRSEKC